MSEKLHDMSKISKQWSGIREFTALFQAIYHNNKGSIKSIYLTIN